MALRKLLEGKDVAARALGNPGGRLMKFAMQGDRGVVLWVPHTYQTPEVFFLNSSDYHTHSKQ